MTHLSVKKWSQAYGLECTLHVSVALKTSQATAVVGLEHHSSHTFQRILKCSTYKAAHVCYYSPGLCNAHAYAARLQHLMPCSHDMSCQHKEELCFKSRLVGCTSWHAAKLSGLVALNASIRAIDQLCPSYSPNIVLDVPDDCANNGMLQLMPPDAVVQMTLIKCTLECMLTQADAQWTSALGLQITLAVCGSKHNMTV